MCLANRMVGGADERIILKIYLLPPRYFCRAVLLQKREQWLAEGEEKERKKDEEWIEKSRRIFSCGCAEPEHGECKSVCRREYSEC